MIDTTIPPVTSLTEMPEGAICQEASFMSGLRYIACAAPAVAIVDNGDRRPYYMCFGCTMHNLRNRGASVIHSSHAQLSAMMVAGQVKVKKV